MFTVPKSVDVSLNPQKVYISKFRQITKQISGLPIERSFLHGKAVSGNKSELDFRSP